MQFYIFENQYPLFYFPKRYIKKVPETVRYREQACKFCSGILSPAKKVGSDRLAAACHRAEHTGKYGCHIPEEILSKNPDRPDMENPGEEIPVPPTHGNIRGKEYYR
jgi:hypothetical protein